MMRTALAIVLLLSCCALDTWLRFRNTQEKLRWWGQGNFVSRSYDRFNAIRSQLPKRSIVGYQFHGDDSAADTGIMLARYHLAPVIVLVNETPQIILDDDGKALRIRGHDEMSQLPSSMKRLLPDINLPWLLWAWGLPGFAVYRLLKVWSQAASFNATPVQAWSWWLWLIGVSWGASIGLSSVVFALWNFVFGAPTFWYIVLESSLWIGMLVVTGWPRRAANPSTCPSNQVSHSESIQFENGQSDAVSILYETMPTAKVSTAVQRTASMATISLLILLGASLLTMAFECAVWNERCPHGINDAIMIWNLRARFLHRLPDDWSDAFSANIWHADYPLLLPASVARGWYFTQSETVLVPILLSNLFLLGLVTVLTSAATLVVGPIVGCLLGIVLLSTPEILLHGMSQIADLPFAYFVSITATSWVIARRWPAAERTLWLMFGISLGAALWLKNEGVTWAALGLFSVITMERQRWSWRLLGTFWMPLASGLGLFLAAWIAFHLRFPTVNDLVAGQGSSTSSRLVDGARHGQILISAMTQFVRIGPGILLTVGVYCMVLGFADKATRRFDALGPILLLSGQALCYYLAYLTSPFDLKWHLNTSLDRVFLHLWPSALFVLFIFVRSPSERSLYDAERTRKRLELLAEMQRS